MLVTNGATRHPPVRHIGMDLLPNRDLPPALHMLGVAGIEVPEPRHVLQIEIQAAQFAVDLECVSVLAAVGEAGGFEVSDGAISVLGDEDGGVLDLDFRFATLGTFALIYENSAGARYRFDVARQIVG